MNPRSIPSVHLRTPNLRIHIWVRVIDIFISVQRWEGEKWAGSSPSIQMVHERLLTRFECAALARKIEADPAEVLAQAGLLEVILEDRL